MISVMSMVFKLELGLGGMALGKLADVIGYQQVMPLVALFGFGAIWVLTRIKPEPKTAPVMAPLVEQT